MGKNEIAVVILSLSLTSFERAQNGVGKKIWHYKLQQW